MWKSPQATPRHCLASGKWEWGPQARQDQALHAPLILLIPSDISYQLSANHMTIKCQPHDGQLYSHFLPLDTLPPHSHFSELWCLPPLRHHVIRGLREGSHFCNGFQKPPPPSRLPKPMASPASRGFNGTSPAPSQSKARNNSATPGKPKPPLPLSPSTPGPPHPSLFDAPQQTSLVPDLERTAGHVSDLTCQVPQASAFQRGDDSHFDHTLITLTPQDVFSWQCELRSAVPLAYHR